MNLERQLFQLQGNASFFFGKRTRFFFALNDGWSMDDALYLLEFLE
jgi:hypothetical protein